MAHAQNPEFVWRRKGRVHLNRQGRQFSGLLAAEVCTSAVVMLDTPSSEVVWRVLATHSIRQFPLHFLSLVSRCAITFQLDFYSPPNIVQVINSRRMRWAGHVALMVERRDVYRVLVGKPEAKRPLGRPRRRWEDNTKMDLQEVGCGVVDWLELIQDRERWQELVTAVISHGVP